MLRKPRKNVLLARKGNQTGKKRETSSPKKKGAQKQETTPVAGEKDVINIKPRLGNNQERRYKAPLFPLRVYYKSKGRNCG